MNILRAAQLAIVALFMATGASAAEATAPAAQFFVITYATGPAWKPGAPLKDQGLGPHVGYMTKLRDAHRLFAAGPFPDSDGDKIGMVIVKAASLDEAKDIMAHDPAMIAGIFTGQVQHWMNAFEAGQAPSAFLAGP